MAQALHNVFGQCRIRMNKIGVRLSINILLYYNMLIYVIITLRALKSIVLIYRAHNFMIFFILQVVFLDAAARSLICTIINYYRLIIYHSFGLVHYG